MRSRCSRSEARELRVEVENAGSGRLRELTSIVDEVARIEPACAPELDDLLDRAADVLIALARIRRTMDGAARAKLAWSLRTARPGSLQRIVVDRRIQQWRECGLRIDALEEELLVIRELLLYLAQRAIADGARAPRTRSTQGAQADDESPADDEPARGVGVAAWRSVPPLFPRWTNTAYRAALIAILLFITAIIVAPMIYIRTPYASGEREIIDQPVQFDHRHHARDDGIDCLYCHTTAENSAYAGIPPTELCMGCHGQIWQDAPQIAPVRDSWLTGRAIGWKRVHDLPDYVYFHHGVHVKAGLACANCHGDVANMARVWRVAPLTMGWCLDCHRNPPNRPSQGRAINHLTTCTACHR